MKQDFKKELQKYLDLLQEEAESIFTSDEEDEEQTTDPVDYYWENRE